MQSSPQSIPKSLANTAESSNFEYLGSFESREIRDYISHIITFLACLNTSDYGTGLKVLFMKVQFEEFYKQLEPFLDKLEQLEKET